MNFHVITLFPDACKAYTDASILGRAQAKPAKAGRLRGKAPITVKYYDLRDFAIGKHNKTDDRPYGGGPGMVMYAEPILKAVKKALGRGSAKVLIMSPRGKQFDQEHAKKLAKGKKDIVLIAGRYEGIDARVKKILKAEEVSVGPYTLTGGELPALSIIDAVSRHIPGVLGKGESIEESRVSSGEMYTRPDVLVWQKKKYKVPDVLKSGHHKNIDTWRGER